MKIIFLLIPFFVFILSSCAEKGFYQSQQKILKQECEKLNSPQYETCLRELDDQSYDDYRREREDILRDDFVGRELVK